MTQGCAAQGRLKHPALNRGVTLLSMCFMGTVSYFLRLRIRLSFIETALGVVEPLMSGWGKGRGLDFCS